MGSIQRPLLGGEILARAASGGGGVGAAGADVGQVGQGRQARALAGGDDLVGAGRGQVVGAAGQGPRDPHDLALRVGDHLEVHPLAAVLAAVVGPAVTEAVALGERPVHQHVLGVRLLQDAGLNDAQE